MKKINKTDFTYYFICLIIVAIPIFGSLDKLPIRLWDESRLAINAIEMSKSSNWWVTTFEGQPEMWNTKPPLLIWAQAIMIKLFGFSPIAIRLPVSIAVFITVLAVFKFVTKTTGKHLLGLFAVMVLVTSQGYLCIHVGRTGDFDGFLILFTTLSSFSFFNFLVSKQNSKLYQFFIFLSLAVLSKSIAGLLFVPGLVIFAGYQKQILNILKNKHFYFGILLFSFPIIGYYLIREHYNPGYIKVVIDNELGGRYLNTIENHNSPFNHYFKLIVEQHLNYWIALLVFGIGFSVSNQKLSYNKLGVFAFILSLSYLIIVSFSKTKLDWYDAPIYPFTAILVAIAIYQGFLFLKSNLKHHNVWQKVLPILFIVVLFQYPYYSTIHREVIDANGLKEELPTYALTRFIKSIDYKMLDNLFIVSDDYIPHIDFYILMMQSKGIRLKKIRSNEIKQGIKIATDNFNLINNIQDNYNQKIVYDYDGVKVYVIINKKENTNQHQ